MLKRSHLHPVLRDANLWFVPQDEGVSFLRCLATNNILILGSLGVSQGVAKDRRQAQAVL
jgi:hypothetical protein